MVIHAKAQEILWSKPPILDGKITMWLGGMHLYMAIQGSIGTIYDDGGLHAILTESGVFEPATDRIMISGKQYARGCRSLISAYEALYRNFILGLQS